MLLKDGKIDTKKMPIEVNMGVAGHDYKFVITTGRPFQIVITFLDGLKKSYADIIEDLDGEMMVATCDQPTGKQQTVRQRNAEAILSALDAPGGEKVKLF